jgi:hypothetical protein
VEVERDLTPEECEEVEAWVTATVAEAFLMEDEDAAEALGSFDASLEAQADRAEFAQRVKAAHLDERFGTEDVTWESVEADETVVIDLRDLSDDERAARVEAMLRALLDSQE